MLRPMRYLLFALLIGSVKSLGAQDAMPLTVKTFTLRNLSPEDAAKLISPYVLSRDGGVFDAGSLRAITVRENWRVLARIDSLLREHDAERATLAFRFQLVAALDTAPPSGDPAVAGIDSALRGLFRFAGYKLLAEGTATAEEQQQYSLTMSANGQQFGIQGWVQNVQSVDGRRSVRVSVELSDEGPLNVLPRPKSSRLFSTGLTMPLGQTLVLGSAASARAMPALILVVRPDLAPGRR